MRTGHNERHIGLQDHSIGDLYPWTIRARDNRTRGYTILEPFHCITGKVGPGAVYGRVTSHSEAYRWCEEWIRDQLEFDATRKLEARLDRLCGKD